MYHKIAPSSLFDDLRTVWEALPRKSGQKIPTKKSLNPAMLKTYLSNIGIAEHKGGGDMSFRLLGAYSREFWGEDLTGKSYQHLGDIVPKEAIVSPAVLEALFAQPCGITSLREARDRSRDPWHCEMLALPLADDDGTPKFMIYGFRVSPASDRAGAVALEPDMLDLSTAVLVSAEFVDVGCGLP